MEEHAAVHILSFPRVGMMGSGMQENSLKWVKTVEILIWC